MSDDDFSDGTFFLSLTLFVTGATPRSRRAVANLKSFCETELQGRYHLEIVDLYRYPERARRSAIVAAPTLVRNKRDPRRFAIGDLSNGAALRDILMVSA